MNLKNLLNKLSSVQGEEAASIMKELGSYIISCSSDEKSSLANTCFDLLPKAIPSRQASFAYLIGLCKHNEYIKILSGDDSPRIREAVAKSLAQGFDEDLLDVIDDWLQLENLYRIKKWLLVALKNHNSERSMCLLKNYDAEPELFIEQKKLLQSSSSANNIPSSSICTIVIHTVGGFEELWLEAHGFKGEIVSPGFIRLNKQYAISDFLEFRDIFGVGMYLGTSSELVKQAEKLKDYSVKILFTNKFPKEKTILNTTSHVLSKQGVFFHPESDFALQLIAPETFAAITQVKNTLYSHQLPASISSVVASCMSLLAPEKTSKVLDPCCGAGTLLIEHQKRHQFSQSFGLDKSNEAIHDAKANAKESKTSISFKTGDARRVPFSQNSFDRVICNPPFNKRVKIGDKDLFYFQLIKSVNRVIEIGGVIIIYTVQKNSLKEAAKQENLVMEQEIKLQLDKIQPSIFILRKVS